MRKVFSALQVKSMPIMWSLCIPATCSSADLQHMLQSIIPYNVSVKPTACNTRHSEPLQPADWIAMYGNISLTQERV